MKIDIENEARKFMNSYTNPVFSGYFADPFVWSHGDEYFAVGTGRAEADGAVPSSSNPSVFPLLRSLDLIHWTPAGHALVRPGESLGDSFWAPEIIFADGLWYLYYSVGFGDKNHQIRVATAKDPAGPYTDCAQLTDPREI